jgi:putative ABC transport system substrate-binding protein
MRRRELITLGGVAAWRRAARAQQVIGVLMSTTSDNAEGQANVAALRQGLVELGRTDSHNIRIEYGWGGGDVERARAYAAELVGLSPDAIFASANAQLAPLSRETRTIPIVFVEASDPVRVGYAKSFARPGSKITGSTLFEPFMAGKWLGALKEIAPAVTRLAIMVNPDTATLRGTSVINLKTAKALGLDVPHSAHARRRGDRMTGMTWP